MVDIVEIGPAFVNCLACYLCVHSAERYKADRLRC
jgi:hypothetical protein